MAVPSTRDALTLLGNLEFLIGGLSADKLTGEFTKVVTRRGNVLELTYQDSAGVEQEMRFIGSERQPIVGLRRLAYIPDGETPAESHFLDTSKSASSMTERVPLAGISGVDDHHLAVWHADTLPELDLLATSSTVVNYRAAVGEPTALTVDGVDGFYYVSESLNSLSSPGSTHDAFYLESRAGKILSPIYLAWEYAFASVTAATFTDPDRSKRIYNDGVVQWPVPVHSRSLPVFEPRPRACRRKRTSKTTRGERSHGTAITRSTGTPPTPAPTSLVTSTCTSPCPRFTVRFRPKAAATQTPRTTGSGRRFGTSRRR